MNYRHAYHAGNFADVFKHVLLTRILLYLTRKPAPLRFIDTHAGIGLYDLSGDEAAKTGESRGGIGQLAGLPPGPARELMQPWLDMVGPLDGEGRPARYPGSPILAQRLLRDGDSLRLCELHPHDGDMLDIQMGKDRRVKILKQDGYAALPALIPPPERRGLVLIDPPFEAGDEFHQLTQAVTAAHRKWREGVYAIWHPVKSPAARNFAGTLAAAGIKRIVRLKLDIGAPPGAEPGLCACAMVVVNPPHVLVQEANLMLPALLELLKLSQNGAFSVETLAGE